MHIPGSLNEGFIGTPSPPSSLNSFQVNFSLWRLDPPLRCQSFFLIPPYSEPDWLKALRIIRQLQPLAGGSLREQLVPPLRGPHPGSSEIRRTSKQTAEEGGGSEERKKKKKKKR